MPDVIWNMGLPETASVVTPRHELRRGLQPSEHHALLVARAAVALAGQGSLWARSIITAGFPFSLGFVWERATWFLGWHRRSSTVPPLRSRTADRTTASGGWWRMALPTTSI